MAKNETNVVRERPAESSPSAAVAEQIQRALEMMKRVRTVNVAQVERAEEDSQGNRYILPQPLVLRAGEMS